MADLGDKAKEKEIMERQAVLDAHSNRERYAPYMIDGVAHCCDCMEPIEQVRLAVNPEAARCIDCQRDYERKEQQQRRLTCRI